MSKVAITGNASGAGVFTIASPNSATDRTLTLPDETGTVVTTASLYPLTSGTAVATTSGTAIDFTGIPSWVKRITMSWSAVGTNGNSGYLLQIGTSGGIQNSGYVGTGTYVGGGAASVNFSSGFRLNTGAATIKLQGIITFTLLDAASGVWCMSASLGNSDVAYMRLSGGYKTLSGTLDRVRITTENGTDIYNSGAANIMYE